MSATPTNLTIGIIGAGMIGEPLASHFAKAKHTVRIANSRGPETLTDVASRTGATATTVEQAVHNAHIVIVTIPVNRIPQLDKNLFMSLPSTTIILDTSISHAHSLSLAVSLSLSLSFRFIERAVLSYAVADLLLP